MDEKCFRTFIDAIKFLEKEDLNNDSIKNAIKKTIKRFEEDFTPEQRHLVIRLFPFYGIKQSSKFADEMDFAENDFF